MSTFTYNFELNNKEIVRFAIALISSYWILYSFPDATTPLSSGITFRVFGFKSSFSGRPLQSLLFRVSCQIRHFL